MLYYRDGHSIQCIYAFVYLLYADESKSIEWNNRAPYSYFCLLPSLHTCNITYKEQSNIQTIPKLSNKEMIAIKPIGNWMKRL
jgi:hypothetical protein